VKDASQEVQPYTSSQAMTNLAVEVLRALTQQLQCTQVDEVPSSL
jgi:hypothetical protein